MFEHLFAKKSRGANAAADQRSPIVAMIGVVDRRSEKRSVADASDSATSLPETFLVHTAAHSE
jgi:hypothetical protein